MSRASRFAAKLDAAQAALAVEAKGWPPPFEVAKGIPVARVMRHGECELLPFALPASRVPELVAWLVDTFTDDLVVVRSGKITR